MSSDLRTPCSPTATIISGTVLDPSEDRDSDRVREAIGPWRVVDWHNAYAKGGAEAVDALPGGVGPGGRLSRNSPPRANAIC
ncbi:hypothetical protein [Streptomyces sp. OV198]|uniref:hypothetical protein n=1 Tax=Streptomyces sp. OV198 TaxID=1882787 RepID=UPI001C538F51|nr:hypothetical protein [Streptomyces sp. OV198]